MSASSKGIMWVAALSLLTFVFHAAVDSTTEENGSGAQAVTVSSDDDDTASIPDFDGDGTIGFGDFLIFAGAFGSSQGDEKYDATYDLNEDRSIGFLDFLIFAENFGKTAQSAGTGGSGREIGENQGLIVQSFSVTDSTLTAGQAFTMRATVHNQGENAVSMSLRLYRSTDATIDEADVRIYSLGLGNTLKSSATETISLDWNAPSYAGTYYYGVCDGAYADFHNCSTGARVTVEGSDGGTPDIVVHAPTASPKNVTPGGRFRFRAKVENTGTGPAALTWKRFYRSDDAVIDTTDLQLSAGSLFPMKRFDVGASFSYSYYWYTPFEVGTYFYGLCVDPTIGEANTDNNCSIGVPVNVGGGEGGSPDLIVIDPLILDHRPSRGEFRLSATVRNIGTGVSERTTVRYYRSDDATIESTDTPVRNRAVGLLSVEGIHSSPPVSHPNESADILTAPTIPGTFYYGACVDPVSGESDTNNNCSRAVPINVGVPDLAIGLTLTSTSIPSVGQPFTLTAMVRNQGPEEAAPTTLRYYRSEDANIDAADTPVGTTAVNGLTGFNGLVSGPGSRLAPSGTSRQTVGLNAPSSPGTYYYGACVDAVAAETNADNNCSDGVFVSVVPSGEDPFNIELVFVSDFTEARKDLMRQAARRWETIITEGLPDVNFSSNPHRIDIGGRMVVVDDTVDDLRIFMQRDEIGNLIVGSGGPRFVRSGDPTGLPATGLVTIAPSFLDRLQQWEPLWIEERRLRDTTVHEIAHVLGFGPLWGEFGLRRELTGDAYFSGPLAIQAFNAAGGESYSGNKIPIVGSSGGCGAGGHWRSDVFGGVYRRFETEIMEPFIERQHALSAITIQSLADLGYVVDVSRADSYRLPTSVSTAGAPIASAKPVAGYDFGLEAHGPIYVGDEHGNIIRALGE